MDNSEVAKHIAQLKSKDKSVRRRAADALVEIGAPAGPALREALKAKDNYIRSTAAWALGEIGDASAVPALIEALQDEDAYVRQSAVEALEQIGDSTTLPRKILAGSQFTAQQRIDILERLRHVHYGKQNLFLIHLHTFLYTFPETGTLCRMVLNEEDAEACAGAQAVLNWLNGGQDLLRASQQDPTREAQMLLRTPQTVPSDARPEALLRPANEPENEVELHSTQPTIWQRLFGK